MASPSYGIDVVALAFAVVLAAVLALLLSHLVVQESGGSGGETGSGRGLGQLILERSLAVSLFANRFLGKFSRLNSSASRASRVHVRAMSSRTSRTRALGARSANCWQSYERFLHIAGASTAQSPSVGYPTQNGGAGVGGAFPSETRTRDSEIGSARATPELKGRDGYPHQVMERGMQGP
jgi:hypothetical protein